MHAEHEELWRHRFYLALDHNNLSSTGYYSQSDDRRWPENIEVSSALVIVSFANWPKGFKDPIEEVDREAILRDGEALKGWAGRGLRAYIESLAKLASE